jgi:short subunit dehydrogenase-like uncharacterized protein
MQECLSGSPRPRPPVSVAQVTERDLDVVVFGATSVTGRRVAAYLADRAGEVEAKWAAAGRDEAKCENVLGEIGVSAPETLVAEVDDADSLARMAARARVVLNLVGPYTRHGRPVIEACVSSGAHYVDLSGEIPFVHRMIEEFDAPAAEARVKVVQVCGFEALPADLATLLAAETARERWDAELAEVDVEVVTERMPGGVPRPSDLISGGTLQSFAEAIGDERASDIGDPGALLDSASDAEAVRHVSPIGVAPRRAEGDRVIAPMAPAAFINPPVIHRSAALRAAERGEPFRPFRYREGFALDGGRQSLVPRLGAAAALSAVQAGASRMAGAPPEVRRRASGALRSLLPSSGYGPGPERLGDWAWRMEVSGRTVDGHRVSVTVAGEGHPGYLATATMLGEAGLLLAESGATPERGGHLTPAAALGIGGIDRFARAKLRFSVA